MTLLNQKQWNLVIGKTLRNCDKRLVGPLNTKSKKVERHFAADYTDCQGSIDLGSKVVAKWVSFDIFCDLRKIKDKTILIGELVDVTPLVELENGETLSPEEALAGLGAFAPAASELRKKKVRDGWKKPISIKGRDLSIDDRATDPWRLAEREGGVPSGEWPQGIRRVLDGSA